MRAPAMMGAEVSGMACSLVEESYSLGTIVPRMLRSAQAVRCGSGADLVQLRVGPGSAEKRDRTMLRIAGRTLHRVRDTTVVASRQLGNLSLRKIELKRVQRHRHHGVIAAQADDLDQPALGERLHGVVVERLGKPMAFVQRFGDVVDHLTLGVVETRRAAIADLLDDL